MDNLTNLLNNICKTPSYHASPTPTRSNGWPTNQSKEASIRDSDAGPTDWHQRIKEAFEAGFPDRCAAIAAYEQRQKARILRAISDAWKASGFWINGAESVHSQTARRGKYDPSNAPWNAQFAQLKRWEPGRLLAMFGPPGCGKTQLAASLAWEWALQWDWNTQRSIRYQSLEEITKGARAQIGEKAEAAFLTPYNRASVVIVDDEGLCALTDHRARTLFALADHRYRTRLGALMILSNREAKDFAKTDGPTFSRIRQLEGIINCETWGSYR